MAERASAKPSFFAIRSGRQGAAPEGRAAAAARDATGDPGRQDVSELRQRYPAPINAGPNLGVCNLRRHYVTYSRGTRRLRSRANVVERQSGDLDGRPKIPEACANGGRMAASGTSRMKRLVNMWIAAAFILLISIGELPLSLSLARLPFSRKESWSSIRMARISSRGPHGAGRSAIN